MKNLREKLQEKGWDEEYIEKTIRILEEDKKNKSLLEKINSIVYWVALLICIIGNFMISIVLIPFLITIENEIALGIIIASISLSFGFLFNLLLKDIEDLDQNHHIIAGLFIPTLSLINIFYIVKVANYMISIFQIKTIHDPFIISIIYVLAFSTPYLLNKLIVKNKKPSINSI